MSRPKVVVVLPAYNAAKTLERTVLEIPQGSVDAVLLVDDGSADATVRIAERLGLPTIVHSENRGYGANQKTCYRAALEAGADIVVMLHPDYQYDPALIPLMVAKIQSGCDVVLASRMIDGGARAGGMPWWKRLGNRVLTAVQNLLLSTSLSEFHTGYRAFTRQALEQSGFERFADGFVFDAQMLVAGIRAGRRIGEVACPARYLPEASSVGLWGSLIYGSGCIATALRFRLHTMGLVGDGWMPKDPAERSPLLRLIVWFVPFVLGLHFVAWRFLAGIDWTDPLRNADSATYILRGQDLVDLFGRAPRPWPIPWIYSLPSTDSARVLLQLFLGTAAWVALGVAVARAVLHPAVRTLALVGVFGLGLTAQSQSWDRLIMPESLGTTSALLVVALVVARARRRSVLLDAGVGISAGVALLIRPSLAPWMFLLAVVMLFGSPRRKQTAITLLLPVAVGIMWLAMLLPRQDVAYAAFERDVREFPSAPYASDTFASVLFGRVIGDPHLFGWVVDQGGPPLEEAMSAPRFSEDKQGWWAFRSAYAHSPTWQRWFDESGGLVIPIRLLASEPIAMLSSFGRDLPLILASPWGEPNFPEYGTPARVAPIGMPFFRTAGDLPIDLLLLVAAVVAAWLAPRRRSGGRSPLFRIGLAVTIFSALFTASAWLLVGIELVRHTAPGPLGLRIGLVLALAGALDTRELTGDAAPLVA